MSFLADGWTMDPNTGQLTRDPNYGRGETAPPNVASQQSQGSPWGNLLGGLFNLYGSYQGSKNLQNISNQAAQNYGNLGANLQSMVQFKPFSVVGSTGGASTYYDPFGNLQTQYSLGPQGQAIQQMGLGQAAQFLGQAGTYDPYMLSQRGTLNSLFGAQTRQLGLPTGLEGLTSQALSLGQQGIGQATQPEDINLLRQQYAGLAGEAAGGLLRGTGDREQQIYERIRAAQTPEEERQRLATEERLAAQGRLGISSAAYGGSSPELMAQEQAIAEARNRAALGAMDQARAEQGQQLQTAQALGGLTSQFAGQGSDLQSAALQRGLSLAGLGMQGTELGQGMTNQQLQNLLALQAAGQGSALAQQQLQGGYVDIGRGLLSAGMAPEAALLNLIQPSINLASLQGTGQREGANLLAQLQIAQLQAQQNAALQAAQRQQNLYSGGLGLLTGQGQGGSPSLLQQILGGLGGLFGGSGGSSGNIDNLSYYFGNLGQGDPSNIYIPTGNDTGNVDNLDAYFSTLGGNG